MGIQDELGELHRLLGILQNIDVGLAVLDRDYRIQLWNGFMENHSGKSPAEVRNRNFFDLFPEVPADWLKRKIDGVFLLRTRAFSTWEQRPYVLKFTSYRPITGGSAWMYQNLTLIPLVSATGIVEHICLALYDVTDTALDDLALQEANRELGRLSRTDGLTGLANRRTWEQQLEAEFKRSRRTGLPAVAVMFDIDHFKNVNDTYGHQAGDDVIRTLARTVMQTKRETDLAGRYGGEEFGIVLVDTDIEGALRFCERLRGDVEAIVVEHEGAAIRFTISIGLAALREADTGYRVWLERADQALYRSKAGGRNRCTVYLDPPNLDVE